MDAELRALSIQQPWASLIAAGEKRVENRSWQTGYRGLVAIHAGASRAQLDADQAVRLPLGAVIAVARLTAVHHLSELPPEWRDDPYANGPFCWVLSDIHRLETPVPCRGHLGLWVPMPHIATAVRAALGAAA